MKTSIDIDDQLLLAAKHQAVQQGCSLKQIIENALRDFVAHQEQPRPVIKLPTFGGSGLKPGVNLADSRSLNDIMDGS
ncbi:DUF2191 domain-containing protein [Methylotuvimicrobium buryatense]|uniref:DUF2191 domain-containing protein n=1 Tax=Methylotuvimicrobium buryatense TaxID=95641 RepID=A0A4P9UR89_METBY|nr:DUF2191 domain-containing protein [Methylotuvimicrobium buryatense]QCW83994.1 DUF2191 domain-containing protein [Methylotuvimicrobium buryatense]